MSITPRGARVVCQLLTLLLLTIAGVNKQAAAATIYLQLDGNHQFRFAGYYAALWQGYYDRAGLQVEILPPTHQNQPDYDAISSVVHGDATFGVAGAELLLAHDRGYPVVALAVMLQRSSIDLYLAEDTALPASANIGRVGVADNPMHWLSYELMHRGSNSRLRAGEAVPLASSQPVELAQVNAMFADSLIFPTIAKRQSVDFKVINLENHGIDLPGSTLFTSREVLDNRPGLVNSFVAASLDGWRYALQHGDEIATRLTDERGIGDNADNTHDGNAHQIQKIRELTMYPVVPLGSNSVHRWAAAHEQLRHAGLVQNSFNAEQFIYDPTAQLKKRAQRNEWWLEFGLPMLIVLALAVLFAYGHHWQLQKKVARKLYHEANFDALTQLPNRPFALRYLAELATAGSAKSTHLLFIDLDGFKRVNDHFGHAIGDKLLMKAADRLRRASGVARLVARLGGDEFIAVFCNISAARAARFANNIVSDMKQPFLIDGQEIHIGTSIGGAHCSEGPFSDIELLQRADTAMYHAKISGRGRYREFDQALYQSALHRIELEAHLHKAITDNELSLRYQPIFSLESRRCVGAEALVRWTNAQLGEVSPDKFIPIAEANGMIDDIGAWVLTRACDQWSRWQRDYDGTLELAINVSPRQLYNRKLLSLLSQLERAHGVPAANIKLEITEGLLANRDRETEQLIDRITELGYTFSIDDFGTGYASLNYLRQFPASTLKIDRSFVGGLYTDERNQPLVTAIIGMAHSLGMCVVAEGVETEAQARFLQKLGCDYAQGYLFSKPLTAARFSAFLATQQSGESASGDTATMRSTEPA